VVSPGFSKKVRHFVYTARSVDVMQTATSRRTFCRFCLSLPIIDFYVKRGAHWQRSQVMAQVAFACIFLPLAVAKLVEQLNYLRVHIQSPAILGKKLWKKK